MGGWEDWIGRTEIAEDVLTARIVSGFEAMLGRASSLAEGEAAPQGIHWLLAPPPTPRGELGADGHAARGGFLPPIPLPRRMWAGGEIAFLAPLPIGASIRRHSRIASVAEKRGSSGRLVFVTVDHVIEAGGRVAARESQTIVYREAPTTLQAELPPAEARPAPSPWRQQWLTDPVMLFRYSALTFNGHRIHYDEPYAKREGYPGLIVHGPLIATLLMDLCAAALGPNRLSTFRFRGLAPAFCGEPLLAQGTPEGGKAELSLYARGRRVMSASATFAS
jgi:3-methylfumaryl-CoA hydratase